jgi:hypothetical protein
MMLDQPSCWHMGQAGIDPQATAGAVVATCHGAYVKGCGGAEWRSADQRGGPGTGAAGHDLPAPCSGCTPPADADEANGSCSTGRPHAGAVSAADGHQPSSAWSFRKQRTVNPPLVWFAALL